MANFTDELLSLSEKITDQNIKFENIDALNNLGGLSEVGVFGVGWSLLKLASSVKESLFARNFERFFNELKYLTDKEKEEFFSKYKNKNNVDFGEQALLVLDKIEIPLSANMVGKALYLLITDEIDENVFQNYCHIIKHINAYLRTSITDTFESREDNFTGGVYSLLESLGLLIEAESILYPGSLPKTTYEKSDFGKLFYSRIIKPFAND